MVVTLTDEARALMVRFDDETGVQPRDCLVRDDRVAFVVPPDGMADVIGPGGRMVKRLEETFGSDIRLVEDADRPEDFVANALAPAAVTGVTVSENDDTVAYVEVAADDVGVAIGTDGRNIELARELADRHFDIDDIQLTN